MLTLFSLSLCSSEMSRQTATALPTGTSKCPPSQRVPTLSGTTASNSDLASLFECPVCFDYVLPPILQCQSGHLVCSNCRPKLTCCPTCRGPLGSIRNLAMEKVANSVLFPCKYASSGCEVTLPHTDKAEHEELCEFRPYSCPCPGASCKWQGSLDAVMPHLLHQHKSITTLQGEDIVFLATDINLPGAVDWVMMQSCFGFHFMLVLEKQEKYDGHQQFFAIVQLIGTRKQAENFAYRLELNGHRRRLTWEATPRSIHEGIATAIMNSDCLVFDTSIAQLFAENGNLGINVTISMCWGLIAVHTWMHTQTWNQTFQCTAGYLESCLGDGGVANLGNVLLLFVPSGHQKNNKLLLVGAWHVRPELLGSQLYATLLYKLNNYCILHFWEQHSLPLKVLKSHVWGMDICKCGIWNEGLRNGTLSWMAVGNIDQFWGGFAQNAQPLEQVFVCSVVSQYVLHFSSDKTLTFMFKY